MDNQLLVTWGMMVVVALVVDIGAYIFLRLDWQKNGSTITDRFWSQLFDKLDQFAKAGQKKIEIALVNYHQASLATEAEAAPAPRQLVDTAPVEIVPVSVKNVGLVRRVEFSLDMPLDTQVEVRIGATREAGVTVEKREL